MPIRIAPDAIGRKDQLLEICPMARLGDQSCARDLSVPGDGPPAAEPEQIFSLRCMQNRREAEPPAIDFSANDLPKQRLVEPDGIEPTTPCLQSRCSPS